jgi:hypothetical protein
VRVPSTWLRRSSQSTADLLASLPRDLRNWHAAKGVGEAKVAALVAAFRLGRLAASEGTADVQLQVPHDVFTASRLELAGQRREHILVLVCDAGNRLRRKEAHEVAVEFRHHQSRRSLPGEEPAEDHLIAMDAEVLLVTGLCTGDRWPREQASAVAQYSGGVIRGRGLDGHQVFDPGQLDTTLDALEAAALSTDDTGQARAQAARRIGG